MHYDEGVRFKENQAEEPESPVVDLKLETICLRDKISLRYNLLETGRLISYENYTGNRKICCQSVFSNVFHALQRFSLWRKDFNTIEDTFGNGTKAFFVLIRWLLFLNIFQFVLNVLMIVVPAVALTAPEPECSENSTECCLVEYLDADNDGHYILDFIQGTGFMEKTLLFQGFYRNTIYEFNNSYADRLMYYNLPFFYVWVTIAYFFICLCMIVYEASKGLEQQLGDSFLTYSKLVFTSWNFSIGSDKEAKKRSKNIRKELHGVLLRESQEAERKKYISSNYKKVVTVRIVVNVLVIVILAAVSFGIFTAFIYSNDKLTVVQARAAFQLSDLMRFVYEYLPSVVIYASNAVIPLLFHSMISFERYSETFTIRLNLLRMVILRMFSLCVLYATLYAKVSCVPGDLECGCNDTMCWETFVGQQMYKLTLTTFALQFFTTFIINYPRSLIGKIDNKFAKLFGEQTFNLSSQVLDVVYFQTIAWFGSYYAPLLPAVSVFAFFLLFYIKKFNCLVNSVPIIQQTSQSNSMFMTVIIVSFLFALVPLGLSIAELHPSKSCGPFKDFNYTWDLVIEAFHSLPEVIQNILFFLTTSGFTLPTFIIICCLIYYKIGQISANNTRIRILKETLQSVKNDNAYLNQMLSNMTRNETRSQVSRRPVLATN